MNAVAALQAQPAVRFVVERQAFSAPAVVVIRPRMFSDARGFFFESYSRREFGSFGISDEFVQDNHSASTRGTLRGLHYQWLRPQAKLCRVIEGEVLDVAVDIRRGSPTFAQWTSAILSAENKLQVYIPAGFAHAFVVLSERAQFLYKCTDYYDPRGDAGIAWNDPDLRIDWPVNVPILSEKDRLLPRLRDIPAERLPVYPPHA